MSISTLLGTNMSTTKALLKMILLIPRWDMLVHWRISARGWRLLESPLPCPPAFLLGAPNPPGAASPGILHCALPKGWWDLCQSTSPNKIPIIWIEDYTIFLSKVTVGSKSFRQDCNAISSLIPCTYRLQHFFRWKFALFANTRTKH